MGKLQKKFSILLTLILLLECVFISLPAKNISAASKPQISDTSLTISIGKNTYSPITVYNTVKKATYTYTSSDKKVVTVDKKGYLTGVKAGKAKITVTQTYKKKKTKVGTCTVTVKNASIYPYTKESGYWLVIGKKCFEESPFNFLTSEIINYQNPQASYTYYSNDSSILKISKSGKVIETLKAGPVDVTVKETYKKKTRTVGTFPVSVFAPELSNNGMTEEFTLNQSYYLTDYLSYAYYYMFDAGDDTTEATCPIEFIKDENGNWYGEVKAIREGTVTIDVYVDTTELTDENYKKSPKIGSFTVKVVSKPATAISLESYDVDITNNKTTLTSGQRLSLDFYKTPSDSSDNITITTSDASVVSLRSKDGKTYECASSYDDYISMLAVKPGTATVTFQAGTIKKELLITVTKGQLSLFDSSDIDGTIPCKNENSIPTVKSSNSDIITIDDFDYYYSENGYMYYTVYYTAEDVGEANITVTCDGVEQVFTINVVD